MSEIEVVRDLSCYPIFFIKLFWIIYMLLVHSVYIQSSY